MIENYEKILRLIRPIIPHISTECLEELKSKNLNTWPKADKKYLIQNHVNIVVQINGKKRSIINTKKDIEESALKEEIKKNTKISKFLNDGNIVRSIYIKNKLINFIL